MEQNRGLRSGLWGFVVPRKRGPFSGISIGRWNYIRVRIVFSVKGWGYEGDLAIRASMKIRGLFWVELLPQGVYVLGAYCTGERPMFCKYPPRPKNATSMRFEGPAL